MPRAGTLRQLKVRPAILRDAERIAALATQLGYPSSPEQVRKRLRGIQHDGEHAVFVTELPKAGVIAWVHVLVSKVVESDPEAEIGGLVVDEAHRRSGAGRHLMERAEEWSRTKGLKSVYLRSNVIRKDAHAFYLILGYEIVKTQYAFRKFL